MTIPIQAELFDVDLPVNNMIYTTYQHFPYQPWDAFAELIDNSTQSFFDNRSRLGTPLSVAIEYDASSGGSISVYDNAYGMDEQILRRAVKLAERPPDVSGRCEFGMGMKTSCCWFGDLWSVRTKQMGHPYEYFFEMDVSDFAVSSSHKLQVIKTAKPEGDHYTKIEISRLHREFKTRTLGKIKDRLGSMYERDIQSGDLVLSFNGLNLKAEVPDLLVDDSGQSIRRSVQFDVSGNHISGWVGLLAQRKGSKYAGFNLYRRGRLIMPNVKFIGPGLFPDVSTNVIHQRLTGSLDLDSLPAVHLKNAVDFKDMQEEFEEKLAEQIRDVRAKAISTKYASAQPSQKLEHVKDIIEETLGRDDVVEQIQLADDLREVEFADTSTFSNDGDGKTPYFVTKLSVRGGMPLRIFLSDSNPTALYMTYSGLAQKDGLDVEINTAHPYISDADDVSFDMFLQIAVLEALAEWLSDKGDHSPALARKARQLKDNLMRSAEMQFKSIS